MADSTPPHQVEYEEIDEINETNEDENKVEVEHVKLETSSTFSSTDEAPTSIPTPVVKPDYEWQDQREQMYAEMSIEEWRQKGHQLALRTATFTERVENHQRIKQEKLQGLQQVADQHLARLDHHENKLHDQLNELQAWSMQLPSLLP